MNQVDDRHIADKEILGYLCFKSRAKYVSRVTNDGPMNNNQNGRLISSKFYLVVKAHQQEEM